MINYVELTNFKGYKKEKIDFSKVTLLTGTNSSGKSTIIQALKLFEQSTENFIKEYPRKKGGVISIIDLLQDEDSHFIGFQELKRKRSLNYNEDDSEDIVTFSIEVDGEKKEYDEVSFWGEKIKNNLASVLYSGNIPKSKGIYFIHADRYFNSKQYASSYTENYIPKNNNSNLADYLFDHSISLQNSVIDYVSELLKEIGLIKDKLEVEKFRDTYIIKIDGNFIEHVGSGIRYTIPILLSVITNRDSTICIENPELHLHPKAQTKILEVLVKKALENNNQLIIETHSDHIINATCVLIKENLLLNKDVKTYFIKDQDVTDIPINSSGQFEKNVTDFFDEYENQLEKLIW
ncbi:TPA: AAA family ATPase [Streptococcus suis]